ncbi:hypothetical protein HDU76_010782 [Blyttiomyces sp. JEL0837]|nr:hypothetical protein HDU76_010782 [Blyttiomyces sp. JEL0837]
MSSFLGSIVSRVGGALSGGPVLPFTIGELSEHHDAGSMWSLHNGVKKDDGSPVTVFVFDCNKHKDKLPLAKNAIKRFKTIRHPDILRYIDGAETDSQIIIGTEPVVPLQSQLLDTSVNQNFIRWGLYKLATVAKFLNMDCSLIHGNIRISSIYTTKAGEWRLGGLEVLCSLKDERPIIMDWGSRMPDAWKYAPPELTGSSLSSAAQNPVHSIDSWGFGCLIYEVFNGQLSRREQLNEAGKIPKELALRYRYLTKPTPQDRESLAVLLDSGLRGKGYFVSEFIKATLFLEQMAVKDASEKEQFLSKLSESLDTFPTDFCKYKILPELINALEFAGAGARALKPILQIGSKLTPEEFEALIAPTIVKMFASPDRQIRISLCENLPSFINLLNDKLVNDKIFPNLATGFTDVSPIIREWTLKSVLVIVGKLSDRVINNDLLRFLAKLQTDDEPGIRANTTICLGKICKHMNEPTKKKVLVPAFTRSLHDPFPPARNAGLLAFAATSEFYEPVDIAQKIIPATSFLLMDPERTIRTQAFKNLDVFVKRMEKHSTLLSETAAAQPSPKTNGPETPTTSQDGWASWAMGAISSRLTSTTTGSIQSAPATTGDQSSNAKPTTPTAANENSSPIRASRALDMKPSPSSDSITRDFNSPAVRTSAGLGIKANSFAASETSAGGEENGWGDDDWEADNSNQTNSKQPKESSGWDDWEPEPQAPPPSNTKKSQGGGGGWDDDWEPEVEKPKRNPLNPVSSFGAVSAFPPAPVSPASSVSSFGGMQMSGTEEDKEAQRRKKREELAILREQKKAALAAKKKAMATE